MDASAMDRRQALRALGGLAALAASARLATAARADRSRLAAAWRGPAKGDPNFAGVLVADWGRRSLAIDFRVPLPGRPHEIAAEPGGGLLAVAYRFGDWLLRCDANGHVLRRLSLKDAGERRLFNGHVARDGAASVLYTTETDPATGLGWIGMRDADSLQKLAEWPSGGIDPHQLLLDGRGHLYVANGGVPRHPENDRRFDLHRMDASLAKLDARHGRLLGQWRLEDPRLSLRHLAWSGPPARPNALLGVALQAEHDDAAARAAAPLLAVFDGERLAIATRAGDGSGYAGNIVPAHRGGFALTSTAGLALLWHPGVPERLARVIEMEQTYALAAWPGTGERGGVLAATAPGLVRWHPVDPALVLPWPQPMALDNHWMLVDAS